MRRKANLYILGSVTGVGRRIDFEELVVQFLFFNTGNHLFFYRRIDNFHHVRLYFVKLKQHQRHTKENT
ncbi:hypothetical protein SAMN05192534_1494 [Alteribacillus persepolensis]|uniref:Uncharacterized protein n=1 Tax=Alteribacillus persepolensis TaxID=568899 RepID=A0A1G8KH20_9BACI|nr:hypothetical protein SAMN05192534_1494 [Alteribacillus persepolensis]